MHKNYANNSKDRATLYVGSSRIALNGEAAWIVNTIVSAAIILGVLVAIDRALS